MKKTIQVIEVMIFILALTFTYSCGSDDDPDPNSTVSDIDGNIYHMVKIGTQTWLLENLRTTRYRNGDPIPNVTENNEWRFLATGAYCNYDNDTTYGEMYGRLYNFFAISDARNIAPEGWHVASNDEWNTLIDFLGGDSLAGGKMKEAGTVHWRSPNTGATNESGFTALPGGVRLDLYGFGDIGSAGWWWTSSAKSSAMAYHWMLDYDNMNCIGASDPKAIGLSVRCVKD